MIINLHLLGQEQQQSILVQLEAQQELLHL